jgi:hypothetical protein
MMKYHRWGRRSPNTHLETTNQLILSHLLGSNCAAGIYIHLCCGIVRRGETFANDLRAKTKRKGMAGMICADDQG